MRQRRSSQARRIIYSLLFQSGLITLVALGSFMFMTWLVADVYGITQTYRAAVYEIMGTLAILSLTLVPFNTILYHKRLSEVEVLSDAILKVASGNYTSKIPITRKNQALSVYKAFNKMCDELDSVQMLCNDFINSYSHEFKTPIASINGFAMLLLEKDLSKEDQQKYLEIIVNESGRLSKLSSDSILLSKLSSQRIVTDKEVFDLSEQLRQCSILLSKKWLEKKIDFTCELTKVMFWGNKDMLQHLWINLIDNAIKYTPEQGKVIVKNYVKDTHIIIEITDTGCGIPKQMISRMFVPYFQVDQSHSAQGLGLGLSIVKRIVELCDGTISVKSELNQGTTFTVILPR